jgi:methyl-accepting chemotaxis protein
VLALLRAEDYVAAKEYQDANVAVQADRLNELIDKAINDNAAQAEAAVKESSGITKTILVMAALLIAAGILFSLVIATLLTRGVKKPLDKALHTAADVSKGKLGQPIVVDTQGEFGRAIDALNLMDEKLSTTAEEGSRQAGEVGASMQEVISVINKMSDILERSPPRPISEAVGLHRVTSRSARLTQPRSRTPRWQKRLRPPPSLFRNRRGE